jgi:hypothetical protein
VTAVTPYIVPFLLKEGRYPRYPVTNIALDGGFTGNGLKKRGVTPVTVGGIL